MRYLGERAATMSRATHKKVGGSIGGCPCESGFSSANSKSGYFQCSSVDGKFVRGLILTAVLMLLIVLTFGLLTCFGRTCVTSFLYDGVSLFTNNGSFSGEDDRGSRCLAVDTGLSEYLDVEEKGILKDVRTSFIPPESVYIPPNCGFGDLGRRLPLGLDDEFPSPNILERQTRSFDSDGGQDSEESDYTSNVETVNDLEFPSSEKDSSSGFHSFWKEEGTPNNIRIIQSNIMKKYMDMTMDPCNDFYQFACGNWAKLNPIPKDKAGYDTFEMLRESLDLVLRDLLVEEANAQVAASTEPVIENLPPGDQNPVSRLAQEIKNKLETIRLRRAIVKERHVLSEIVREYNASKYASRRRRRHVTLPKRQGDTVDAEQKAKDLYASCIDSEVLSQRGLQPLLDLLKQLGGWPVLDPEWNGNNFNWLDLVAQLRLYNNDVFIVEWVGPDIKNSDENIIQFDQTSLGLPTRDYFLHDSNAQYLEAYRIFMEAIMNLLGSTKELARRTAEEVVRFETELAKITSSSEDRANVSVLYKRMTLNELHHAVPQIDWKRYLSIVQERQVHDTEMVVIYAVEYMQSLVTLVSKSKTKTLANYLLWRFVRHRVNNLDDRFQEAKQRFFHVLFGREQCPPRWKNCVGQVNSNMGMALGAMFVRKYFDENSKQDTLRMTHELQEAFREILNTTDWLDNATKHLAELKVNSMSLKIGYPDFILSKEDLNKKYEGLHIDRKKYFENTLNVLRHVSRTEQNKLRETVNKTVWQTAPAIVNAYYSRNKNQIMFPAGILQPPFYHRFFPRCLNYGGIGVVIGHELTHGFDDKGRLFDRNGNIHKWWSDYAINGFHERARCLVTQYSNYTVSEVGIPVDGESTQGENIADNGGIRQAFRAYENWLERNATQDMIERETLPGLNMTSKQLFFLNFAQVWCGAMRPEATRSKLKTAVHSPGKFRVIGTLSNSEDFAREFQCPPGAPMNPVKKCSVW